MLTRYSDTERSFTDCDSQLHTGKKYIPENKSSEGRWKIRHSTLTLCSVVYTCRCAVLHVNFQFFNPSRFGFGSAAEWWDTTHTQITARNARCEWEEWCSSLQFLLSLFYLGWCSTCTKGVPHHRVRVKQMKLTQEDCKLFSVYYDDKRGKSHDIACMMGCWDWWRFHHH